MPKNVPPLVERAVTVALGGNIKTGIPKVQALHHTYFHWKTYAQAGQQSLLFFNAARSKHVTNLPQAGTIHAQMAFVLQRLRFMITTGLTTAGAAVAGGEVFDADGLTPGAQGDIIKKIIEGNTEVKLTVGDETLVEGSGLFNYPAGGGALVAAGEFDSDAATGVSHWHTLNGSPLLHNAHAIDKRGFPIFPGDTMQLEVTWPAALALPAGVTAMVGAFLDGRLYKLRN